MQDTGSMWLWTSAAAVKYGNQAVHKREGYEYVWATEAAYPPNIPYIDIQLVAKVDYFENHEIHEIHNTKRPKSC